MTRQDLIANMVSCYDNGDAMLEYVEEYYAQRTCTNCSNLQHQKGMLWCGETLVINGFFTEDDCEDFSCNKWEKR